MPIHETIPTQTIDHLLTDLGPEAHEQRLAIIAQKIGRGATAGTALMFADSYPSGHGQGCDRNPESAALDYYKAVRAYDKIPPILIPLQTDR